MEDRGKSFKRDAAAFSPLFPPPPQSDACRTQAGWLADSLARPVSPRDVVPEIVLSYIFPGQPFSGRVFPRLIPIAQVSRATSGFFALHVVFLHFLLLSSPLRVCISLRSFFAEQLL